MSKERIDKITTAIKDSTYEEKATIFSRTFSSGAFSSAKLENKLALYSLICLVTKKLRVKDGDLTVKEVIEKILNRPIIGIDGFDQYLIGISIVCEDLLYGVNEIDNFGFTDSKQIINKIKELLNEWLPF